MLTKNCTKQFLFIAVLSGLSALLCVFHFISFGNLNQGYMNDFYNYGKMISLAAALAGVLLVPPVFKELYNRQFADVEFSLPMSSSERFKAKLLVLVRCHFIPFAISQAVVLLTSLVLLAPTQKSIIVFDVLCNLINMLFTDAIALISVSSCGHIVECIYTPVLLAAASSLILPLGLFRLVILLSGRDTNTTSFINIPFGYPGITDLILGEESDSGYSARLAVSDTSTLIIWFVMLAVNIGICAGLIILAYRIYKKRDGLSVGKPIVFPAFYRIFIIVVTVAVILFFFMNSLYIAVFVGLLLFLGITVSANRKKLTMKTLELSLLGFCGCLFSILAVGFISYTTCGFGYASMLPDKVFDTDKAGCSVDLLTEKYGYRVVLLPRSYKEQKFFSTLPEYRFADKAKLDQLFDEIISLDKRKNRSLGENLSDYINKIRFENISSEYEYQPGLIRVSCSTDNTRYPYNDTFGINGMSEEEILSEVNKLVDMGYEVFRNDLHGDEDTYLMKEQRYEHGSDEGEGDQEEKIYIDN